MGNKFIQDLMAKIKNKFAKKSETENQTWDEEANEDEVEEELAHREVEEESNFEEPEQEEIPEFTEMKVPKEGFFKKLFKKKPQASTESVQKIKDYLTDLKPDSFINTFFSNEKRGIINHYFIVFACLFGTYYTGMVVATKLSSLLTSSSKTRSVMPFKKPFKAVDYSAIETYNIFNAIEKLDGEKTKKPTGPAVKKPKFCYQADKKSSLPLKLVNTIVLQDNKKSVASIIVRNNREPESFRENDVINGFARIGRINRLTVIFKNLNNEDCEFIENIDKSIEDSFKKKNLTILDPKKGKKLIDNLNIDKGITNEGNSFKIKNSIREEMLGDISNVLTQARAIQIKNPDGSLSFKMTEIVPGSIYSKLNIKDGDILTKIDGKEIRNLNEVMNLFGRIKDIENLSITVKRDGEEETQDYKFED